MTQIPSALLEPSAPPAPTGKEPPGSPPDTPFSTVLDDHQARTAVAEGHDRADQPDAPLAAALAALLGGVPLPAGVTRAVATRLSVASTAAQQSIVRAPASSGIELPGAPAVPTTPAAGAASPMPTGPAVPVAATALPLGPRAVARPVAGQPAIEAGARLAVSADASRALAAVETPVAPAVPNAVAAVAHALRGAASASAPVTPAGPAAAANGPEATPAAGTRSTAASSANGHAAAQPVAAAPAQVAAAPADAPTAPATDPAEPAAATPGVGLEHAVETVRLALRAAADRGVSHARISLTPRELGTIEVHLRQTADGLVARVVAQHAAAAQLLQDSGADLRRQLEQSGLTLLRLDIGASNDDAHRRGERAFAAAASRQSAPDADDPLTPLDGATETTATATLALPNGALVDVLA